MSRKTLRKSLGAALTAVIGAFSISAHAVFIDVNFDPDTILGHFTGNALIDYRCNDGCVIDLISLLITDSGTFGGGWFSTGQTNIATDIISDNGLIAFSSVQIPLSFPDLQLAAPADLPCSSPSLMFTETFGTDNAGHQGFLANLGCFTASGFTGDNAIYVLTVVPEPGTLALILGGAGAVWVTRRRKAEARVGG